MEDGLPSRAGGPTVKTYIMSKEKAQLIKLLLTDVDGVLTDNGVLQNVTLVQDTDSQPLALAKRVSCAAHSRTCATEPGAEVSASL